MTSKNIRVRAGAQALMVLFLIAACEKMAPRDDAVMRDSNHSGAQLHFDRNAIDVTKFRCWSKWSNCKIDFVMRRKPAAGWRLKLLNARGVQLPGHSDTRHVGKDIEVGQLTTHGFPSSGSVIHIVEDVE